MRFRRIVALSIGLAALLSIACLGRGAPEAGPTATASATPSAVNPASNATVPPTAGAEDEAEERRAAGVAASSRGEWLVAIDAYTRAIELSPTFDDYYARATAYGRVGAPDRAIVDLTEAIVLDAQVAAAYNQRAFYFNELGLWTEAVTDLDRAIELRPDRADQYNGRAFANLNLGNWAQVVSDMDTALELSAADDPLLPIYLSNRASANAELGEYALALADLDRSIELDPENFTSHQNGIGLLIEADRQDEARSSAAAMAERLGLLPSAAHLLLSDLFREAGLLTEAIAELDVAIELDPTSPVLHMARAFTYAELGETELARDDYEAARELTSDRQLLAQIDSALAALGGR